MNSAKVAAMASEMVGCRDKNTYKSPCQNANERKRNIKGHLDLRDRVEGIALLLKPQDLSKDLRLLPPL